MRKKIISILVCPKCRSHLDLKKEKSLKDRIQKGKLKCSKCGSSFEIIDDIVCFKPISSKELNKKIRKAREMFLNQEVKKKWLEYFNKEELEKDELKDLIEYFVFNYGWKTENDPVYIQRRKPKTKDKKNEN